MGERVKVDRGDGMIFNVNTGEDMDQFKRLNPAAFVVTSGPAEVEASVTAPRARNRGRPRSIAEAAAEPAPGVKAVGDDEGADGDQTAAGLEGEAEGDDD